MNEGLIGQVSDEQIRDWKQQHKAGIYACCSDTHIAYFREPTRHDVAKAFTMASDERPFDAVEEFARLTLIGGSDVILKDDLMFLGVKKILREKMDGKKMMLVNL